MTIARSVAILRATLLGGALLLAAAAPAFADSPNTIPVPHVAPTTVTISGDPTFLIPAVQNANQALQGVNNIDTGNQQSQGTHMLPPAGQPHGGGVGMADIAVTNAGSTPDGFDRFTVSNNGNIPTETFHVAVIALANSYGFDIANLSPGQSKTYTLPFNDCQTGAVIVANTGNTVKETNYNNDSLVLHGTCLIDDGPALVPASN